ncbi:MAG: T9SS type A sorting domain-containing protein [Paludibacter sp.]|nr:T9SS type A sorting domain-containing protein [Paludibacter sp.]
MQKFYSILFLLFFQAIGMTVMGGNYVSIASGSLTDPAVWSLPWVGAPVPPGNGQTLTITAGTIISGTPTNNYSYDISGTMIVYGDLSNSSGGMTIEDGGSLIITGNLTSSSALVINGNGTLKVVGNLNETGGSITINNTGDLVVGGSFTEGWQTTNLFNNATILVIQNYNVNGNMTENGSGTNVAVLGTVAGGGCGGCVNSISPTDPAWLLWTADVPNYWNGTTSTNWGTASNWTANIVPASGANIEFANPATRDLYLDADRTVGKVINKSNKSLVITPGNCLTVTTTITTSNNPNQIYIQASSSGPGGSLIFHNDAASPVQASVEMYSLASWNLTNGIGGKYKWQFFGIPVRSISTATPTFDGAYVREMHENDSPVHWYQLNNYSSLSSFKGYEITQAAAKTYLIQGALENSNYSVTQPYTSGVSYPGESLIANSYTAAIDIKKMVFGSDMLATVYLYNTGTRNDWVANGQNPVDSTNALAGQYTAIPFALAGTGTLPGQVPSMQAFLVRAKLSSANATLSIPYSTASTVVKNTIRQRVGAIKNTSDSIQVWTQVDVKGSRFTDRMWIFTVPSCTHGFDNGYDGEKFLGSYIAPQIYAMEEDGDYQVNSVDNINNSYLGFQPGMDSLYTLTFTHQNLDSRYPAVYLVDSLAGTTVDITASGSTYAFKSLPTDTIVKRFKIVTSVEVATSLHPTNASNHPLFVFSSQNTVFVDNTSSDAGSLQLFDVTGRLMGQYPFQPHVVTTIHTGLTAGSYVARATTKNLRITNQLIVK